MLTLLIVLALIVPYLAVGARYSRNRYALLSHQAANPNWEVVEAQRKELSRLRAIDPLRNKSIHSASCEQHVWDYYSHCTCGATKEVDRKTRELAKAVSVTDGMDKPSVFAPMMAWPVYKGKDYLTSGTVPETPEEAIARMEAELRELQI